jgi:serine/threonine protein phosphatase 1
MGGRTFAIGDIHGDAQQLFVLLSRLPALTSNDTIVFLGDYVDRGPRSRDVIEFVRNLPKQTDAKVIALRGNHEDAWLRVVERGWPGFVLPPINGCLAAYRSFVGGPPVAHEEQEPEEHERETILNGRFWPPDVLEWMRSLPYWYEDEHALYVHAGLPKKEDHWPHPSELEDPTPLLWLRDEEFFFNYRGKYVVFGHTVTSCLPPELSGYTPDDPTDLWAGVNVIGIDTGCGKGGFLTAVELPALHVYESR